MEYARFSPHQSKKERGQSLLSNIVERDHTSSRRELQRSAPVRHTDRARLEDSLDANIGIIIKSEREISLTYNKISQKPNVRNVSLFKPASQMVSTPGLSG